MLLSAMAFSVKPGGEVQNLLVKGDIVTHGANVNTYAIEGGKVDKLSVVGQIVAQGDNSNAIMVDSGGTTPLTNVKAHAAKGKPFVNRGGTVTDTSGFEEQP